MAKQAKKVTLESLAAAVEAGFKRMDKGFKDAKENVESLARMVANGFEQVQGQFDVVQEKMATKADIAKLEQGQENIQLRVDSLAPNFEVKAHERRIKRLEDRAGLRHTIPSR